MTVVASTGRSRLQTLRANSNAPPPHAIAPAPSVRGARFRMLYLLAIPLLAFAAYGNSLVGEFVWDDRPLIIEDHTVKSFDYLEEIFTNDFFSRNEHDIAYGYYRPIVSVTYVIDYAIWGEHALGYHLTNVLMHSMATVLLVLILMRIGFGGWTALLAGLLFAVHPIHTESVTWISGRTDVLALLLTLGALLAHCFLVEGEREGRRRWVHHGLVYLLFALALLAKEMAVVLLPWIFFHRWYESDWKTALRRTLPLVAVPVLYGLWRFVVIDIPAPQQSELHSAGAVVLSALPTVLRYFAWMVAPYAQEAYVQNPYVTGLADPRLLVAVPAAIVVGVLLYRSFRTHRAVCLLVLALLSSFLPLLNVVRIAGPDDMGAVMAERFAYFPSAPFLALVAAGFGILATRLLRVEAGRRGLAIGGAALLLAAMTGATAVRNRVWNNDLALFEDMRAKTPEAPLIWSHLAFYHLRRGELAEAEQAIEVLDRLSPDTYWSLATRASLHVTRGEFEAAVAPQEKIIALTSEPNAPALNNLAFLYVRTGRSAQAIPILEDLTREGQNYSSVHANLALAYEQQGRLDEARRYFRSALEAAPDSVPIGLAWATFESKQSRLADAEAIFRGLLEHHPTDPSLHQNLAIVLLQAGKEQNASLCLQRAIGLDPNYVRARLTYGKLLQRQGEAAQARAQFEEVIRRAPNSDYERQARELLK